MKELLSYLLENITGSDRFEIDEHIDEDRVTLTINADESLVGLIIGKRGDTIKAIRNLVKIKAALENKLVNIEVLGS